MATPLHLDRTGALFKLDPNLGPGVQEFRTIYASPRLKTWIENVLPTLESTWKIELTPQEQLQAFVEEVFCPGEPLTYEHQFKPITHIKDGIWELKTADLRMFGWFFIKDCFIGSAADLTDNVKRHHLYYGYAGEAARFRDGLDLDEPKFVPGDDPHAVVSNFGYP
jgi:hypothetical protein